MAICKAQDRAQWQASAEALVAVDARFRTYVDRFGAPQLRLARESAFVSLSRSIVFQQLHGAAAARIWQRLAEEVGAPFSPAAVLSRRDETFRLAGLSRHKLAALRDLALRIEEGTLKLRNCARLTDYEIVEALTQVRGIGRWTAEMFLIFHLRRPDVWPITDYGVRKGFARAFGATQMPTPRDLQHRADAYRPHRSALTWYLWQVAAEKPASVRS